MMTECLCPNVYLNNFQDRDPVGKSLNEDCPLHGLDTAYYRKTEQKWNARLRALRKEARGE